jgi:hypothetical protein
MTNKQEKRVRQIQGLALGTLADELSPAITLRSQSNDNRKYEKHVASLTINESQYLNCLQEGAHKGKFAVHSSTSMF